MYFCAWYESIFEVWRFYYEETDVGPCDGLHIAFGKRPCSAFCKGRG